MTIKKEVRLRRSCRDGPRERLPSELAPVAIEQALSLYHAAMLPMAALLMVMGVVAALVSGVAGMEGTSPRSSD